MTDRELKKLNRMELLEMLLAVSRENESLLKEVEDLRAELEDRRLTLEKTGSIAEAALTVNGVFEAAQAAADQYLTSIKSREAASRHMLAEARRTLTETRRRCAEMLAQAGEEAAPPEPRAPENAAEAAEPACVPERRLGSDALEEEAGCADDQ